MFPRGRAAKLSRLSYAHAMYGRLLTVTCLALGLLACGRAVGSGDDESTASGGSGGAAGGEAGQSGSAGQGGSAGQSGSGPGGGGQGGSDAEFWQQTVNACPSEGKPTAEDRPEGDGDSIDPIVLALSRLRLGAARDDERLSFDPDAWQSIGLDVDGRCSEATFPELSGADASVCRGLIQGSCAHVGSYPLDGHNCRDNGFGRIMAMAAETPLLAPFHLTEADWSCALHAGTLGVLVKISSYNGKLDDEAVRVDVYSSSGLAQPLGWSCEEAMANGSWPQQASWLKSDRWRISDRSIDPAAPSQGGSSLRNSNLVDASAYVRNGHLVARLNDGGELWLNGAQAHTPGFRFKLHRSTLVARLSQSDAGDWALSDGTLGAALKPGEVLTSFRELGVCENMCDANEAIIEQVQSSVDLLSNSDDVLPTAGCDAISFGMAFEARAATPGQVVSTRAPLECPAPPPGVPPHGCVCPADAGPDAGTTCF